MSTISGKYAKTLIHREFIKELAHETVSDLYSHQASTVSRLPAYNHWWHEQIQGVSSVLRKKSHTVTNSGNGVKMVLNYPLELRLMDLKYFKNKMKKPGYVPVYNRMIGGFIFGYFYKMLINGISAQMNEAITQRLQSAGYKIQ